MAAKQIGDRTHYSVSSHLNMDYQAQEPGIPGRVIFALELTGTVELFLFLRIVHFRVEINLGNLERFVTEPNS
jgi:hypothetical protein